MTGECDSVVVLCKMPHIFANTAYTNILKVYGFCDGSATGSLEEYRRRVPMRRIPDRRVFSKVFNALLAFFSLLMFNRSEQQESVFLNGTALPYYEHAKTFSAPRCFTNFTHSMCKMYTQGTVKCVKNFVTGYIVIANCFH